MITRRTAALNALPKAKILAALERGPFRISENGCREWMGTRSASGYGAVSIQGGTYGVHRAIFVAERGPILDGLCICHHCDNPPCFEISHLFSGTNDDNVADMMRKGRNAYAVKPWARARGAGHGSARLNEEEVAAIFMSPFTHSELAHLYGVDKRTIGRIKRKENWSHLTVRLPERGDAR